MMENSFFQRRLLFFAVGILCACCTCCSRSSQNYGDTSATSTPSSEKGETGGHSPNVLREIEEEVDHSPQMLLDGRNDRRQHIKSLCERISKVGNTNDRRRLFQRFQRQAFSLRFEEVGDVHSKEEYRNREVRRRLGGVYASLELLADELQWHLMSNRASVKEQFEPLFALYEKLRNESLRVDTIDKGYPDGIKHIERMYGTLVKTGMFKPEDFKWVKTEFQRLAGRPIRTLDEASKALANERRIGQ